MDIDDPVPDVGVRDRHVTSGDIRRSRRRRWPGGRRRTTLRAGARPSPSSAMAQQNRQPGVSACAAACPRRRAVMPGTGFDCDEK